MARKSKARSRNKRRPENRSTNIYDVLIRIVDALYNLTNNGNFVGVVILCVLAYVFYVTGKVSQGFLEATIIEILSNEIFYLFPLGLTLSVSVTANFLQAKYYKSHIRTLTETRKELIHGLNSGQMKHLTVETTSGIDPLEADDDC